MTMVDMWILLASVPVTEVDVISESSNLIDTCITRFRRGGSIRFRSVMVILATRLPITMGEIEELFHRDSLKMMLCGYLNEITNPEEK